MNFLSKGLAGLESRLDRVLLVDDNTQLQQQQQQQQPQQARTTEVVRRSSEMARTSMQERLAAAVAKKQSASGRNSPVSALGRLGRASVDEQRQQQQEEKEKAVVVVVVPEKAVIEVSEKTEPETTPSPPPPPPLPLSTNGDSLPSSTSDGAALSHHDLLALVAQLRSDLATCESRRQEESHEASERIDALGEKLRFLASETASAARDRTTSTPTDKKLAEKDEKIALLIEEGERLARNELKLQTTIKRLRTLAQESVDAKKKAEKAEKLVLEEKEKTKKALEAEKRANDRVKALAKVDADLETARKEKLALEDTVRELKGKLEEQAKRALEAEGKVQADALEAEKNTTADLKAQVERVQNEAATVEGKLRSEISDLNGKIERVIKRARGREAELKGELSVMESKMEGLRGRVEEASSSSAGDAHAKLLRQVETLQSQYSIASENWQGIEGSLLARIAGLEKERDELAKKETDVRRKVREMNAKCKTFEADLEAAKSKLKDLESDLTSAHELTTALRTRLSTAESTTESQAASFRRERADWERELQAKIQEERTKWEETTIPTTLTPAPGSSQHSPFPFRPTPPPAGSTTESYFLGGYSRKLPPRSPSVEPPPRSNSGFRTPPIRQDSLGCFPYINTSRTSLPSTAAEDEYYFEGVTPSSPHRHPDLVSVSTVAAGPSVQLIERMSANVRRLESEMAGSREEIGRIVAQRDEARAEIVALMREVETLRGEQGKVDKLQEEAEDTKMRLETTLELLGEKSERVMELTQDVEDLKEMYRELVLATSGGK